jgi:hypothetical protein
VATPETGSWVALMPGDGFVINPWTNKPFTNRKDCVKAVKYKLSRGYWPGDSPGKQKKKSVK